MQQLRNLDAAGQSVDLSAQMLLFNPAGSVGTYAVSILNVAHAVKSGDWVRVKVNALKGGFPPIIAVKEVIWGKAGNLPAPVELTPDSRVENTWAERK